MGNTRLLLDENAPYCELAGDKPLDYKASLLQMLPSLPTQLSVWVKEREKNQIIINSSCTFWGTDCHDFSRTN